MASTSPGYGITIRVEGHPSSQPVALATAVITGAGATITALDVVESLLEKVVIDITCDTIDASHADEITKAIDKKPELTVRKVSDRTFLLHLGGKIEIQSKVPLKTRDDLSRAYTPGVARICQAIADDPADARRLTIKTLELIDCPDRRLPNAALEYSLRMTEKPDVELTLLLPRRAYSGFLGRLLHDQTAEEIAAPISQLQRVVATIVPFDVDRITSGATSATVSQGEVKSMVKPVLKSKPVEDVVKPIEPISHYAENLTPIGEIKWRKRAQVQGRVTAIKSAPRGLAPILQVEVWDQTGGVTLHFIGRREISGLEVGSQLRAEGMVGEEEGSLTILNPSYELLI